MSRLITFIALWNRRRVFSFFLWIEICSSLISFVPYKLVESLYEETKISSSSISFYFSLSVLIDFVHKKYYMYYNNTCSIFYEKSFLNPFSFKFLFSFYLLLSFPQQLLSLPILKRVIIHTQHHPKLNWFRARAAHISCGPEPPNPISDLSDPGPNPDPESQQHAELPGAEAHPYEARGHASEAHEAIQRGSTEALGEVGG